MKKKEIVIVVLLIAFGFIYNAVEKGKIRFSDDFSRYFNEKRLIGEQYAEIAQQERIFPAPQKITISNPAGEISIDKSADGQVHLLSFFRVYYTDKADVEAIGRNAISDAKIENNELNISGNYAADFPYKQLRIRFELLVPEGVALAVSNHEGNISIRQAGKDIFLRQENGNVILKDIPSSVEIKIKRGNLDVRNITGSVAVDARQGDIFVENAHALHVQGRHGNYSFKEIETDVFVEHAYGEIVLDGAGQAEISGRHSHIEIRNIKNGVRLGNSFQSVFLENIDGDVRLASRSSKIEMRHVNAKNMVVENSFADITITDYAGDNLNIILKNGNLILKSKRISDRLNIEARQANLDLTLGMLTDPTVNVKTLHGRIVNQSALDLEVFQERGESFANRSGQRPEIIINNSYGDIYIK